MKKQAIITLLITTTLLLSACGSGGGSSRKSQEYIGTGNSELNVNTEITPILEETGAISEGTPYYTEEDLEFFYEVALKSEYGNGPQKIKKWATNIRLKLSGDLKEEDYDTIEEIITEIHTIQNAIQIQIVSSNENATLTILSEKEMRKITGRPYLRGFVTANLQANGIITRSKILIGSYLNSASRKHVIREELTQSLGLLNDVNTTPQSIFYNGMSFTSQYTEQDIKTIALLYNPSIEPGMSKNQLQNLISL